MPISRLTLVADEDYLHAELTINAEELVFFAEWDDDGDRRLESEELTAHGAAAANAVIDAVVLQAEGRTLVPEVAGLVPGGDPHHLTFRAHYATDVREAPLQVESRLDEVTRGAHTTEAVFQTPHARETAVLNTRSPQASFNSEYEVQAVDEPSPKDSVAVDEPANLNWMSPSLPALAAIGLTGLLCYRAARSVCSVGSCSAEARRRTET